jgi:hypothetical protein
MLSVIWVNLESIASPTEQLYASHEDPSPTELE